MSTSQRIRELYAAGRSVSEIARELGIRYQFADGVLRRDGLIGTSATAGSAALPGNAPTTAEKPLLRSVALRAGGFDHVSNWVLGTSGDIVLTNPMPKATGVYAFTADDIARYVGVTLRTFDERMRNYRLGHASQPTNVRMRQLILQQLTISKSVNIFVATPKTTEWNGWPVNTIAGLEPALISTYRLDWNRKGV